MRIYSKIIQLTPIPKIFGCFKNAVSRSSFSPIQINCFVCLLYIIDKTCDVLLVPPYDIKINYASSKINETLQENIIAINTHVGKNCCQQLEK